MQRPAQNGVRIVDNSWREPVTRKLPKRLLSDWHAPGQGVGDDMAQQQTQIGRML
jgi:hypothetical protein